MASPFRRSRPARCSPWRSRPTPTCTPDMRPTRFDYGVWITLGTLTLALGGLVLSLNWVGVRVLQTIPAASGVVDPTGQVGVDFAQPMQANSAQPPLQIDPAL